MGKISYFLKYNSKNEEDYKEIMDKPVSVKDLFIASERFDEAYNIEQVNYMNIGKRTFHEFNRDLESHGQYMLISINPTDVNNFASSEIEAFDFDEELNRYKKVMLLKREYKLMDRKFRQILDKSAYQTVILQNKGKMGYSIENYPESLEVKMELVSRKLQLRDLNAGIYISVDEAKVRDDMKKYIIDCHLLEDKSIEITNGHYNLIEEKIPENLSVLEKKDYIHILKNTEKVAILNGESGYIGILLNNRVVNGAPIYHILGDYDLYKMGDGTLGDNISNSIIRLNFRSRGINTNVKNNVK